MIYEVPGKNLPTGNRFGWEAAITYRRRHKRNRMPQAFLLAYLLLRRLQVLQTAYLLLHMLQVFLQVYQMLRRLCRKLLSCFLLPIRRCWIMP